MALKLQKFMNRRVLHKVSKSFNTDGPQLREEIGESEVNNQETAVLALSDKTRTFEKSKTVSNVVLPLKITRMANPFPDPVKMMRSQIISDKDKSEQMLAEAKHCFDTLKKNRIQ